MKTGLTISITGHAAMLLWALVSFSAKPFEVSQADSLPVDIISETDFSQMMAGSKTAPKAEKPKPLVDKVAEPKETKDDTPKVSDKQEIVTASTEPTPPPMPEPKPPEPKPVPVPPQTRTETKPEKAKTEPKVDPIAEALKKEEAKKPQEKPKPQQARKEPTPPKKTPPQPRFDPTKVAALLDKRDPRRHAASGDVLNSTASLGVPTGNAPRLSQSEIDALRAQIQACWNTPAGAADAKDLIVKVRLMLNQDGSLSGEPIVLNRGGSPFFQVAAESAMRAIRRCQPYRLPIAKYEVWKDVEVTFDPRDMFRG
jgi:outer membrane biosynthesis protein TonB